ncbi:MAG: ferrous iron transporter B [Coxiellaceae bacterium]|nr:ferrous iron transporter B [Coxiellaceae bacterium]|tara:strand:+ start:884 stop:3181 length:2298 start_codon:yes stop_codon:yes gene_type:complete
MNQNTKSCKIALAGNPNCGKTALFNQLTGSSQRVGNWAGVTVDKKTGDFFYHSQQHAVVDLPGVYSLSVTHGGAEDQRIACQALMTESIDVIVNVVDATNLERHLYLTMQLLELDIPVVVALNMTDRLVAAGKQVDCDRLAQSLGCPVVPIIATQKQGLEQLKKAVITQSVSNVSRSPVTFPTPIEKAVEAIVTEQHTVFLKQKNLSRWMILSLLAGDQTCLLDLPVSLKKSIEHHQQQALFALDEDIDIMIADTRYGFIEQCVKDAIDIVKDRKASITERIDRIVLHRFLGLPIFFAVMYALFFFSINVAGAFQDFFDIAGSAIFVDGMARVLKLLHVSPAGIALLSEGVGIGISTTLTFIPVIGGMFLFLSFLEDSGYMARAAFIMDRVMVALGLSGHSFVPMIVGFGCNVPAVMGARTLSSRRERILTVLMMPFMSCGARLAIFSVFVSAFFQHGAMWVFMLYVLGILAAMLTGFIVQKTLLPGDPEPLVMELPPYHWPRMTAMSRLTYQRLKAFVTRAGRVIIPVCLVIGGLNAITDTGQLSTGDANSHSLLSVVGRGVTPVFAPMGITQDNWPATVGLVTGIMAKEVVVGTLNTLYTADLPVMDRGPDEDASLLTSLGQALQSIPDNLSALGDAIKNPLLASEAGVDVDQRIYGVMHQHFDGAVGVLAYLLFVLLYFPCVSTMAAMRREVGMRWAVFSVVWSTGFAYVCAVLCYQLGTLYEHPTNSLRWLVFSLSLLALILFILKYTVRKDAYALTASLP